MRPKLKTKHSYSHLCISLPPHSLNTLRLLACSCVVCSTGRKPTSQGSFGLRQAWGVCQKNHTTCSKEGAGLPFGKFWWLQEVSGYADTVIALEEGLGFSVSTQGTVIPHFSALCYGLSSAPLLRERQEEKPLVRSLGSILLLSTLCLMAQSSPCMRA